MKIPQTHIYETHIWRESEDKCAAGERISAPFFFFLFFFELVTRVPKPRGTTKKQNEQNGICIYTYSIYIQLYTYKVSIHTDID